MRMKNLTVLFSCAPEMMMVELPTPDSSVCPRLDPTLTGAVKSLGEDCEGKQELATVWGQFRGYRKRA